MTARVKALDAGLSGGVPRGGTAHGARRARPHRNGPPRLPARPASSRRPARECARRDHRDLRASTAADRRTGASSIRPGPRSCRCPPITARSAAGARSRDFLARGGRIAWGAIPTDGPRADSVDRYWRALAAVWCELVRGGCDPVRLRTQAIVTPECGLAPHTIEQADQVLGLTQEIADRVLDQAVATRFSLGA